MNLRLAIVAAFLLRSTLLFAQPGPAYDTSIEAKVAQAASIFVGTISHGSRTTLSPPWTNGGKGETGPYDGSLKYTVTLQTVATIKGKERQTVELETGNVDEDHTNLIEQWIAPRERVLCLANNNDANEATTQPLKRWMLIRLGEETPAESSAMWHWVGAASPNFQAGETSFIAPPVYTMDFSPLTNGDVIIDAARRSAREKLVTTHLLRLEDISILDIPVTTSFEGFARRVIETNGWRNQCRAAVVRGLQYFNKTENIELLKSLLNDAQYWDRYITGMPWNGLRKYEVRQAAWDVLQGWGVVVTRPVTEEKLPWHYDPAVRRPLEVQIPVNLVVVPLGPSGANISVSADLKSSALTNVMVGSNMIAGVTCEWFLYPEDEVRAANPARFEQIYWPAFPQQYFSADRGDAIVKGKRYVVEVNYTLFETDSPPPSDPNGPDEARTDLWRPQDGKNYRVLAKRTLATTFIQK